jgi:phosphatidylinositol alpha-mannosyltransferase
MRWGYESQVAAMGIPDVEFAGRVSSELLPRYYASADIFCAPATGGESFGIVLLEAMASGVPVIASSIPGFSSVIVDGVDGVLVPPRHPKEWAVALGALLGDPSRRHAMSERGLAKAQLYDWEHVVDEILDVYRVARERAGAITVASSVHVQASELG